MSHPPHLIVIALAAVASAADPPAPRFRFSFDDGSASASDDINPLFSGVVENYATTAGPDGTTAILNDPTSSDSSDQTYVVWDESTSLAMLPVAAAPRTVCLRARVDVFDGGALFHYGDPIVNGGSFILKTQAEDGKMKLKLGGNRDLDDVAVNGDGAWHHYCAAYDAAARASLYEDGVLLQSEEVELDTASAVGAPPQSARLHVMAGQDTNMQGEAYWQYLRGAVDDLRIYDVALDAAGVAAVAADVLAPDPPPLVAHYSFDDGTATEDSDSSLDGTITGATATTGLFGSGALSFDGSNDYVEFPSAVTSDILGSSARTVCLWAVINSFGGDGGLFDYGAYSDQANFALRVHGTSASLYVELWGGDTGVALSGSDDGGWHHYCLTYDGSGWVLYFDGSQAATATAALDTGSDRPLQIGRFDSDYYLDGSIDEVYVYASALDEASIQVLYDAGSTAAPTAAPTTAPTTALLAAGVRYCVRRGRGRERSRGVGEPALAGTIVGEHALAVGVDGGGAVDLSGGHAEVSAEVTSGVLGSAPRTLCLWALRRGGGALASYGGDDDGPTGRPSRALDYAWAWDRGLAREPSLNPRSFSLEAYDAPADAPGSSATLAVTVTDASGVAARASVELAFVGPAASPRRRRRRPASRRRRRRSASTRPRPATRTPTAAAASTWRGAATSAARPAPSASRRARRELAGLAPAPRLGAATATRADGRSATSAPVAVRVVADPAPCVSVDAVAGGDGSTRTLASAVTARVDPCGGGPVDWSWAAPGAVFDGAADLAAAAAVATRGAAAAPGDVVLKLGAGVLGDEPTATVWSSPSAARAPHGRFASRETTIVVEPSAMGAAELGAYAEDRLAAALETTNTEAAHEAILGVALTLRRWRRAAARGGAPTTRAARTASPRATPAPATPAGTARPATSTPTTGPRRRRSRPRSSPARRRWSAQTPERRGGAPAELDARRARSDAVDSLDADGREGALSAARTVSVVARTPGGGREAARGVAERRRHAELAHRRGRLPAGERDGQRHVPAGRRGARAAARARDAARRKRSPGPGARRAGARGAAAGGAYGDLVDAVDAVALGGLGGKVRGEAPTEVASAEKAGDDDDDDGEAYEDEDEARERREDGGLRVAGDVLLHRLGCRDPLTDDGDGDEGNALLSKKTLEVWNARLAAVDDPAVKCRLCYQLLRYELLGKFERKIFELELAADGSFSDPHATPKPIAPPVTRFQRWVLGYGVTAFAFAYPSYFLLIFGLQQGKKMTLAWWWFTLFFIFFNVFIVEPLRIFLMRVTLPSFITPKVLQAFDPTRFRLHFRTPLSVEASDLLDPDELALAFKGGGDFARGSPAGSAPSRATARTSTSGGPSARRGARARASRTRQLLAALSDWSRQGVGDQVAHWRHQVRDVAVGSVDAMDDFLLMALTATLVVIPNDMRDLVLKELVAITAIFASTAAVSLLVFFGVNAAINDAAPGLSQILLGLLFVAGLVVAGLESFRGQRRLLRAAAAALDGEAAAKHAARTGGDLYDGHDLDADEVELVREFEKERELDAFEPDSDSDWDEEGKEADAAAAPERRRSSSRTAARRQRARRPAAAPAGAAGREGEREDDAGARPPAPLDAGDRLRRDLSQRGGRRGLRPRSQARHRGRRRARIAAFAAAAVFFVATGVDTDAGDNGTDADTRKKVSPFKTCSSTARWAFGKLVSSFRQQLVFFIREMRAFGLSN
ncbi:hypothetical protein SO694_00116095 [Aureococcus anophagefferens]|uniref:LamG-like jellyroll fold domain-containing protein n=1 Tax=Aureococcus anophagefferens TaxID=44056 RepID=A0ABR1FWJ5_AURAN